MTRRRRRRSFHRHRRQPQCCRSLLQDILRDKLRVTEPMLDALFRALHCDLQVFADWHDEACLFVIDEFEVWSDIADDYRPAVRHGFHQAV